MSIGTDYMWRKFGDTFLVAEVEGLPVAVDLARVFADEKGFNQWSRGRLRKGIRTSRYFSETSDAFARCEPEQDRSAILERRNVDIL